MKIPELSKRAFGIFHVTIHMAFTDDKKMIISPWLSKMTLSRLNIAPNKQYPMLPTEGREHYLEYHRAEIFKG